MTKKDVIMQLEPANVICPKCGNPNYMRYLVGKNVGRLNMKCINCNSYFSSLELFDRLATLDLHTNGDTNGDRFRAMTDEELAELFSNLACPYRFGYKGHCNRGYEGCKKCWLEWLKQEATL